jgi:hydroxypyruvate isomerase
VLSRYDLFASGLHVSLGAIERDPERVLEDAASAGCGYVVVPHLRPDERTTLNAYRQIAKRLNQAARHAAQRGLRFAYHNHDFEFLPLERRLPYDLLLEDTDPGLVDIELDVYWTQRAGQDPLVYFRRWPGRIRLVHLKDIAAAPSYEIVDVGAGTVDWHELLEEGLASGVRHWIVEHDSSKEPLQSAMRSFRFLSGLAPSPGGESRKRLKQSVARWTVKDVALSTLCGRIKSMGFSGVDLLFEDEWPVARASGLECALSMPARRPRFIADGFSVPEWHTTLVTEMNTIIPKAALAGVPAVVASFGNLGGRTQDAAQRACIEGLRQVASAAERYGVTVSVELLNSRVDHPDYAGDHTEFGLDVVQAVNSPKVRLLFDIYHMQVMEGNLISTIQRAFPWISSFHTAGVPGRGEIDRAQEIQYEAIAALLKRLGYRAYVGHEFVARGDPFAALSDAFRIFDFE